MFQSLKRSETHSVKTDLVTSAGYCVSYMLRLKAQTNKVAIAICIATDKHIPFDRPTVNFNHCII